MEVVTRCPARSHDAASPMTIAPMPQLPRTVNVFVPASPTRAEIVAGLRITAPVAAGYIPLGLAYGLLVVQLGLPWWMAPALSLAAYSGSAELLVVTLASHNTPLAVIAVTMLLVNFRLIFFAFSFPLHVIEGRVARLLSMYALVDEAFPLRPGASVGGVGRDRVRGGDGARPGPSPPRCPPPLRRVPVGAPPPAQARTPPPASPECRARPWNRDGSGDRPVTPTLAYLLAILVIVFVIDFTLRALPFKILEPLRDSRFVSDMAAWMPPGIMLILVMSTLVDNAHAAGDRSWAALVAAGVTVAVHLLSGRRLLWSVGIGTVCYVALLNWQ